MNLGEGFSLTKGLHNTIGAVTPGNVPSDTGNMFNFFTLWVETLWNKEILEGEGGGNTAA